MYIYLSQYRENEKNCYYKTPAKITCLEDLEKAVNRDHIAAAMTAGYRNGANFIQADCIILDLDNTHSADPADWKTLDDITDAFPDVPFYYIYSRNHMKEKTKTDSKGNVTHYEPRPKYHCYFPLSKSYRDFKEYEAIMLKAAGLFPFFDLGAAKPAQFYFGVADPTGGTESGGVYLDELIAQTAPEVIAESVRDFAEKVANGTYSEREGREKDINEKALSRLYSYLGITQPAQQQAPGAGNLPPAQADGEYSEMGLAIAEAEQKRSLEWLRDWGGKHDINFGKSYRIKSREHPGAVCICVTCPWEHEHSMNGAENESVVMVELGGKLNYLCRHSHGPRYGWKEYRAFYEERDADIDGFEEWRESLKAPAAPAADNGGADPGHQQPEAGQTAADPGQGPTLPGLLTYTDAVDVLQKADDKILELEHFPEFSKTARIKLHDSVVLAADTGGGKSSLALNFLNDLNKDYPCIYINLEMDTVTILRRLAAIQSGLKIDRIAGYKNDSQTADAVNIALKEITGRKTLQVVQDEYYLEDLERLIANSTAYREESTIVFIDHSLLVRTKQHTGNRYERFTEVSERLRQISLKYNIILFVLLQQNRAGKAEEEAEPKNSSLKESGSWENDATLIMFLWWDPKAQRKKIIITKNRNGGCGRFILNYWKETQTYRESSNQITEVEARPVIGRRDKQRQQLQDAYDLAYLNTNGNPTLQAMAEAADVRTATIKGWLKEFGGCLIDGVQVDPAGMNTAIDLNGFVRLLPENESPFDDEPQQQDAEQLPPPIPAKKGKH